MFPSCSTANCFEQYWLVLLLTSLIIVVWQIHLYFVLLNGLNGCLILHYVHEHVCVCMFWDYLSTKVTNSSLKNTENMPTWFALKIQRTCPLDLLMAISTWRVAGKRGGGGHCLWFVHQITFCYSCDNLLTGLSIWSKFVCPILSVFAHPYMCIFLSEPRLPIILTHSLSHKNFSSK